ncbi:MAG: EamA family transporter [Myxococcales bacterium]|nr:EamA family transporter [Myxococcales bacterium]
MLSTPSRVLVGVVLAVGVLAVSASALMVQATLATSLQTAIARTTGSALLMGAIAAGQRAAAGREPEAKGRGVHTLSLGRSGALAMLVASTALGLHFWSWMASLDWTSPGSSTVMVTTTPVWLALLARWIPGEPQLPARGWAGLALGIAGMAMLSLDTTGRVTWFGMGLAVLGAWTAGAYFVASRLVRERSERPWTTFEVGAATNAGAALVLTLAGLATGEFPFEPARADLLWFMALVLIPQMLGHNAFLWALRHVPTTTVSTVLLLEPAGTLILAVSFLGQAASFIEVSGILVLLTGVGLVTVSRRPSPETTTVEQQA